MDMYIIKKFLISIAPLFVSGCENRNSANTTSSESGTVRHGFQQPDSAKAAIEPDPARILYKSKSTGLLIGLRGVPTLADDDYLLTLKGAPKRVHALDPAPSRMEPVIKQGKWLILVFSTLSVPDVDCAADAIYAFENRTDDIHLGLRPFRRYKETEPWYGPYGSTESPLWILYNNGKVIKSTKGRLSKDEIRSFVADKVGK